MRCLTTLFCQQIDNDLSISRNILSNKMIHAILALVFLTKLFLSSRFSAILTKLSVMALLPQNVIFQFTNANIPPSEQLKFNLSRMIRPMDFTSYAIPLALNTRMTACFPFSQKEVRHFIFQLLKPPSLKLPTLFSADKKNSFIT